MIELVFFGLIGILGLFYGEVASRHELEAIELKHKQKQFAANARRDAELLATNKSVITQLTLRG